MNDTTKLLCALIKCYLDGRAPDFKLDEAELGKVCQLARSHDVEHLIGIALSSQSSDISKLFFRSQMIAVMRSEQQSYERARIYEQFEKFNIDYLPLKGSVIRELYPEPWHRTSCDIDILVREEELDRATSILAETLGYEVQGKSEHDVSLMASDTVHLELHYDFHEEEVTTSEIWEISHSVNGTHMYEMPSEVFIYCHLAHMAKHFKNGGCGLRGFIDLWIIEHNMPYDKDALWRLLEEKGLKRFAEVSFELVEYWFGDRSETPLLLQITDYILNAGAYGSKENKVAIDMTKKKNRLQYFLSRIFLSRDQLKYKYPVLEKYAFMLPVCQVRRWCRLIFGGKIKNAKREIDINLNMDESYKNSIESMINELEI